MEKISTIFASSPRVRAVDTEDSPPARPGAPKAGRLSGASPGDHDRVTLSPVAKEAAFNETMARHKPSDEVGRQIIEKSTKDFFENRMVEMGENPNEEAAGERLAEVQHEVAQPRAKFSAPGMPAASALPRAINKYA